MLCMYILYYYVCTKYTYVESQIYIYCTKGERVLYIIIVDTQLVVYQMCIFHGMLSFALNIIYFFFYFIFFRRFWNALLVTTKTQSDAAADFYMRNDIFTETNSTKIKFSCKFFEHLVLDEPIISKIMLYDLTERFFFFLFLLK